MRILLTHPFVLMLAHVESSLARSCRRFDFDVISRLCSAPGLGRQVSFVNQQSSEDAGAVSVYEIGGLASAPSRQRSEVGMGLCVMSDGTLPIYEAKERQSWLEGAAE